MTFFRRDHPNYNKCAFLMMKFEDSPIQKDIVRILKREFNSKGIDLLRVDDKQYHDNLLENILVYMHGCSFGVALFDTINSQSFNPNVSLEVGYMMALKKPLLLMKDNTMMSLQSDLIGRLYHSFDYQNPEGTIPNAVTKWLTDKDLL